MTRTLLLSLAAACGGGAARPAPIANTAGTAPAAAPAAPDLPAFQRLLTSGDWDTVIDPATGVVEMSAVASAVDEAGNEFWVKRRCGDKALTIVQMVGVVVQKREIEQPEGYDLACHAEGPIVTCGQGGLGEYDLSYGFRFEPRGDHYVLTGISTVDVGTVAETETKNYEAELTKTGGC